MTSIPLLPAQPSSTPPAARGTDADAAPGDTAGGQRFADLLAAGSNPVGTPDRNSAGTGASTGTTSSKAAAGKSAAARHAAHHGRRDDIAPDGTSVAVPESAPAALQPVAEQARYKMDPAHNGTDQPGADRPGADQPAVAALSAQSPAARVAPHTDIAPGHQLANAAVAATTSTTDPAVGFDNPTGAAASVSPPTGANTTASEFGKLISQFGKPSTASATTSSESHTDLGHVLPGTQGSQGVAGTQPIAGTPQPGGTARPFAVEQPGRSTPSSSGGSGSSRAVAGGSVTSHIPADAAAGKEKPGSVSGTSAAHGAAGLLAGDQPLTAPAASPAVPPAALAAQLAPAPTVHTPVIGAPAATTTPAPPTASPMPPPLHSQVTGTLLELRARGDGTHRVLLELHPVDLGQVTVEVRMHGGSMSIDLGSANPDTRHSLASALPQLRSELADAGLGSASVAVGADTSGGSAPRGESQRQQAVPAGYPPERSVGPRTDNPSAVSTARIDDHSRLTGVDRWL